MRGRCEVSFKRYINLLIKGKIFIGIIGFKNNLSKNGIEGNFRDLFFYRKENSLKFLELSLI